MVGLHGTDAASVFVSAWARMTGGTVAAVERALYEERVLLRVLAMRRTMFVAPVELASVMLAACSRDLARRERAKAVGYARDSGHGADDVEAWWAEVEEAAVRALNTLGEATAPELAAEDERLAAPLSLAPGTRYAATQKAVSRALTVLGASGRAVRARPTGGWSSTQFRWAPLVAWQPAARLDLDADAARAELAGRWLRAFGPARTEDLKWWTGWPLGVTRRALAAHDTVEVTLEDGSSGLMLRGDVNAAADADPEPWVALLPALDPTTMGWQDRAFYLGDRGPKLFDRNGNAGPTLWVDGQVVGGWACAPDGEVRLRLLVDVGGEARERLTSAAHALTGRLGDVRLAPRARARSPLEAELLA